jgi:hypothetical protein
MKKATLIMLFIPMLILTASLVGPLEQTAYADRGDRGDRGRGGGISAGGRGAVDGRGFSGREGFGGRGGFVGRGGGFDRRGGGFDRHDGHFRGGGHFDGGIWIGPWWGWDPFFYPYYPYYPYQYYAPPTVVVPEQPQEYIVPAPQPEESSYWYFCRDAKGYYPYVKSCPGGWMKVVPSPSPPDQDQELED